MSNQNLRFAPIIRVSTEDQENKGESLTVQRTQITQYVEMLGGYIPDHCWKYVGQEHATPNHERKLLDQLLKDSAKDRFDAVIVADGSRWSRDNKRSKEGIEIFKRNNIRFFAGMMEFNLFDPNHEMMIGITAEINEWQAKQQTLKSTLSRIERLQKGRPSAGKPPHARTWSEKEGWGTDPEKHQKIKEAARRYLNGDSLKQVAKEQDRNYSGLLRILKYKCGPEWNVSFNISRLNIDTTVKVTVPSLLDESTIKAIHRKADKNKTYNGPQKAKYLLSKYLYCASCGYNLHSQTPDNIRYYRHATHDSAKKKCTHPDRWHYIPANKLEFAVLSHLKSTLGNPAKVEQAIQKANPDTEETQRLRKEQKKLKKDLDRLDKERKRIVKLARKGTLTEDEIADDMEEIREQKEAKDARLQTIKSKLSDRLSTDRIKKLSKLSAGVLRNATRSIKDIKNMPFKEARALIEQAFDGKDADGNDLGIYIKWKENKEHEVEVRGHLEKTLLNFPISDRRLIELFNLDTAFLSTKEIEQEIQKIRQNINEYSWHWARISVYSFSV